MRKRRRDLGDVDDGSRFVFHHHHQECHHQCLCPHHHQTHYHQENLPTSSSLSSARTLSPWRPEQNYLVGCDAQSSRFIELTAFLRGFLLGLLMLGSFAGTALLASFLFHLRKLASKTKRKTRAAYLHFRPGDLGTLFASTFSPLLLFSALLSPSLPYFSSTSSRHSSLSPFLPLTRPNLLVGRGAGGLGGSTTKALLSSYFFLATASASPKSTSSSSAASVAAESISQGELSKICITCNKP